MLHGRAGVYSMLKKRSGSFVDAPPISPTGGPPRRIPTVDDDGCCGLGCCRMLGSAGVLSLCGGMSSPYRSTQAPHPVAGEDWKVEATEHQSSSTSTYSSFPGMRCAHSCGAVAETYSSETDGVAEDKVVEHWFGHHVPLEPACYTTHGWTGTRPPCSSCPHCCWRH
jgi:hypothetical protein